MKHLFRITLAALVVVALSAPPAAADECAECNFYFFTEGQGRSGIAMWCDSPRGEWGYDSCTLECDALTCYCRTSPSMCMYIVVQG